MMALETQVREIDGIEIHVTQAKWRQARKGLHLLTDLVGPLVEGLSRASSTQDVAAVGKAFEGVLMRLSDEKTSQLTDLFIADSKAVVGTLAHPVPLASVAGEVFDGHLLRWAKWLVFAIEVNYADFLGEAKGVLARLQIQAAAQSKSPFQRTATGPAGDSSAASA